MSIRCAQIGVGRWGKNILRNLYSLPQVELVAIGDQQRSQVENLPFYQKTTPIYEDPAEIINQPEIEAVFIATPVASHFALASQALKAGKHVFVEKPLTLTLAELDQLTALAEEKKLILMEGHLLLYHPAVMALKEAIAKRRIGQLHHLYFRRTNLGAIRFEASVLWDVGPHDLSVMLYLLDGEVPTKLSATGRDCFLPGRDEVVFLAAKFADGLVAHIQESWLDPYKERKVIAVGTEGMLIMDEHATDGKVKLIKKRIVDTNSAVEHERFQYLDEGVEVIPIGEQEPLASELSHFVDCALSGKTPKSNAQNSRKVLELLLSAQESIEGQNKDV